MEMSTNTSILSSVLCRAFTLLLLGRGLSSGDYFCPWNTCTVYLCEGDDSGVEGRAGEAGLRETPGTASWWVARQEEPPEVVEVEPVVVEVILDG